MSEEGDVLIDLGDDVMLPNGTTAKVVGWQRMLGQNTEWCLRWWDEGGPNEIWANNQELDMMSKEAGVEE